MDPRRWLGKMGQRKRALQGKMRQRRQARQKEMRQLKKARKEELARQRLATARRSHLLEAPAGAHLQAWVLWKPGVDPRQLYGRATSSFLYVINRWRLNEEKFFDRWLQGIDGKDCYACWSGYSGSFDSQDSTARRVVLAVRAIQDSDSFGGGQMLKQELTTAHGQAWDALVRASGASAAVRQKYLTDVAESLDNLVLEVRGLDADLRSSKNEGDLEELTADGVREQIEVATERVREIRKFLTGNDQPES